MTPTDSVDDVVVSEDTEVATPTPTEDTVVAEGAEVADDTVTVEEEVVKNRLIEDEIINAYHNIPSNEASRFKGCFKISPLEFMRKYNKLVFIHNSGSSADRFGRGIYIYSTPYYPSDVFDRGAISVTKEDDVIINQEENKWLADQGVCPVDSEHNDTPNDFFIVRKFYHSSAAMEQHPRRPICSIDCFGNLIFGDIVHRDDERWNNLFFEFVENNVVDGDSYEKYLVNKLGLELSKVTADNVRVVSIETDFDKEAWISRATKCLEVAMASETIRRETLIHQHIQATQRALISMDEKLREKFTEGVVFAKGAAKLGWTYRAGRVTYKHDIIPNVIQSKGEKLIMTDKEVERFGFVVKGLTINLLRGAITGASARKGACIHTNIAVNGDVCIGTLAYKDPKYILDNIIATLQMHNLDSSYNSDAAMHCSGLLDEVRAKDPSRIITTDTWEGVKSE